MSSRPLAASALGLACALASSCSAIALRESDCKSDSQCVEAFGPGSVCTADGSCEAGGTSSTAATETEGDTECGELCTVVLGEECTAELPVLESSAEFVLVSTLELRNDFDELSCLDDPPLGNDGFFALELAAGERWHFHVRVTEDTANPAVYVLPQCDERSCQNGDGLDLCGDGSDEHLSFVASTAGRYIVGIDGRAATGTTYELLALRPTCGNGGMPEHSESCDDGNATSLDGCDANCRAELRATAPQEAEPNDDRFGANVLLLDEATSSITIQATAGGRCDFDNFAITVPEGATLSATVNAASGDACDNDAPPLVLRLLAADAVTQLGAGSAKAGNQCPAFGAGDGFATALAGGEYFIRVFTGEDEDAFDYSLAVGVQMP